MRLKKQMDGRHNLDVICALGFRRNHGNREIIAGMELTAVFKKVPEGYIAWVEELPGANTRGSTPAEARENLLDAVEMRLRANHELSRAPVLKEFSLKEKILPVAA